MTGVIVQARTPRIEYTLELVFGRLLGTPWITLLPGQDTTGCTALVNYTSDSRPGALNLPVSGLLYEAQLRSELPPIAEGDPPLLFPRASEAGDMPFDPLAAIFYLATRYDLYTHPGYDAHGRYAEAERPFHTTGLYQQPFCHLYSEMLARELRTRFPGISLAPPRFDYEVTIDIDHPWKLRHKNPLILAGGAFKELTRLNWRALGERLRVVAGSEDPYDTYALIREICPRDHTRIFFLIERHSPLDSRYTHRNRAFQQLIRSLDRDFPTGLHPSYETFLSPEKLQEEATALRRLLPEVTHSRQHYLRYRLPDTFRSLEKAGIQYDYSICPVRYAPFPTGLCIPFPWYDLPAERTSSLVSVPGVVMDRGLMQYQGLDPKAALEQIQERIRQVRQVGGKFVVVLHNETFSGKGEWLGWDKLIRKMIQELKQDENGA